MKTVLFYFSKGSKIRVRILQLIQNYNIKNKPIFLNIIAKKLKISHVATKKHIDILEEYSYVKALNPNGKPLFLTLTKKGKDIIKEFE